jgi:hypothetical protein
MTSLDFLCNALDHYRDELHLRQKAVETNNRAVINMFQRTRILIFVSALSICIALVFSPVSTAPTLICVSTPALLWDVKLFKIRSNQPDKPPEYLSVKRIPVIKPLLVGIMRGYGTCKIVDSIMLPSYKRSLVYPWTMFELVVWPTMNRACDAVSPVFLLPCYYMTNQRSS